MPKPLVWAQESLAKSLHCGKDAAATCALRFGLSRLRRFPGLTDICAARAKLISRVGPETMDFFDAFGTIAVDTGDAGTTDKAYRRHINEQLAKELGQLADELGMHISQFVILVLMAAHLDAKGFVRPQYQACMFTTLRRFCDALARRAARAREHLEAAPAAPEVDAPEYSMNDLFGPDSMMPSTKK